MTSALAGTGRHREAKRFGSDLLSVRSARPKDPCGPSQRLQAGLSVSHPQRGKFPTSIASPLERMVIQHNLNFRSYEIGRAHV